MVLNSLGIVTCALLLNSITPHTYAVGSESPAPSVVVTIGQTQTVTLPPIPVPGSSGHYKHVTVAGRPWELTVAAVLLVLALIGTLICVRHSIGPATGRVIMASLRADRLLAWIVASCLLAIVCLVVADAVGLPRARGLIWTATILYSAAALIRLIIAGIKLRRASVR